MKKFVKKTLTKLRRHPILEVSILSGAAMLLVLAAVFISEGGMTKINNLLAVAGITAGSQTGCIFPCNNTAYQMQQLVPMQTVNGVPTAVSTVLPGSTVYWQWIESSYGANNFTQLCMGATFGANFMCTVAQDSPNTNFGTCNPAHYGDPYCPAGQESLQCGKWGCSMQCDVPLQSDYYPAVGCGNADAINGDACFGPSGTIPPNYQCPGYHGNPYGTTPLTAPLTPGTYAYYLCSNYQLHAGAWNPNLTSLPCLGVNLTVALPAALTPTLTIDAGAGPGVARTVAAGTAVTITTTAAPGSGDTITGSSIVDSALNTVPGVNTSVPPTGKSYVFTPSVAGTYIFYPSVRTTNYPTWNNYAKSVTITVTGSVLPGDTCTDIPGTQPTVPPGCTGPTPAPSGLCVPVGSTFNGTACVPVATCTGANQVGTPPNCTCEVGYQMQSGSCVQVLCAGPNEVNWPTCSCASGFSRDSATNVCIREPQLDIEVNGQDAVRVRKGTSVSLTWSATGVAAGSCRVTTNTGATLGSSDTGSASPVVSNQSTYRLTCNNDAGTPVSKEANATLIPEVIEQ